METGIKAKDIMEDDFPILDSSLTLENCIKQLNRTHEACIVLQNGFVKGIVSYDELLNAFLKRKTKEAKIQEIKMCKNFAVVKAETDILEIIKIMRKGINFIIVKEGNFFGLITKKEIAENNELLFDNLAREQIVMA